MDLRRNRGALGGLLALHRLVKAVSCASTPGEHWCLHAPRAGMQKDGAGGEMQFLGINHAASSGGLAMGKASMSMARRRRELLSGEEAPPVLADPEVCCYLLYTYFFF